MTLRPGEIAAPLDPAERPGDAQVIFIGCARTPWTERSSCPKNPRDAGDALGALEIDSPWRLGLSGLAGFSHVIVLTWMDRARRDLVLQVPRHLDRPRGVFSLRSPVRPNPIGLVVAELVAVDEEAGRLAVRGLDCLDGTPLIDLKPYYPSIDAKAGTAPDRS